MTTIGAKKMRERRALSSTPEPVTPEVKEALLEKHSPIPQISNNLSQLGYVELFWPAVQQILRSAAQGYTESWGDFTRECLLMDDHIASTYITYGTPIASARREVVPAKVAPALQHIADLQALDCEAMFNDLNPEQAIKDLVDADTTGWSVLENLWRVEESWLKPYALDWIHPNRIRFSDKRQPYIWDNGLGAKRARELNEEALRRGQAPLFDLDSKSDVLGVPLVKGKYIVHLPRVIPNYDNVSGLFRAVVKPWFVKVWATKFWLMGAELAGNPRLIGELAEMAPESIRQEMFDALSNLSADGIAILTGGSKLTVLDVKAIGEGSVWYGLIKLANASISKAILGSTLLVEVGDTGGNRSLGESQADMTLGPRRDWSAMMVANTIRNQLFKPFLEYNAGHYGGQVFLPTLKLHIVEDEPTIDQVAIDSGYIKVDQFLRSRGLPPLGPENGGDDFIPAKTAAAPMPFSASGGEATALPLTRTQAQMRALAAQTGTRITRR